MAGLLDFLDSPDARLGIGLLAAAGPSMQPIGFGQRLSNALGYVQSQKEQDLAQQLNKAKLEEFTQQAALRKQQADQLERRNALVNQMLGAGYIPQSQQTAQAGQQGGQFASPMQNQGLDRVPQQALAADLSFNEGKGLADMIYKAYGPNMDVSNGYLYDKNRAPVGYLPQLKQSDTGQTSMVQIGPDGLPIVSAPRGAMETYGAYRGIDEAAKAGRDIQTITSPSGQSTLTTRERLVQGINRPSPYAGGSLAAASQGQREILTSELSKAIREGRADDIASIQRELSRIPQGLSGGIPVQSETEKAVSVEQGKQNVQPVEKRREGIAQLNNMVNLVDKASSHPGLSASTGLQGYIDPRNYIPGTKNADFRALLDQIQGNTFLAAYNQLKGGGQISNTEGAKAENAIARLQRSQTTESFKSALGDLKDALGGSLERNKMAMPEGTPTEFAGDMRNSKKSVIGAGGWSVREVK